jgi:hypothetical protein
MAIGSGVSQENEHRTVNVKTIVKGTNESATLLL